MWRVLIAVGVVVLVLVGAAVWFFTASAGETAETAATPPVPSPSASVTQGPLPDATPTTGSEVPQTPESETETDSAGGLPALPPPASLLTEPLPESASGSGQLVDGFPAEVMGPAPGAEVVQNDIATEGGVMQVSLLARTDASPEQVSDHYAKLWASKGLVAAPPSPDGSLSYTSAFDSLTLAFTPAAGTGTVYMVHGVFRTS
ncbi:hypothetical protein ASF40_00065 [Microbacterium sp. Leaf288]|nr:hypothetical protein ASF40_00065 [Microbacterium sp. Leaf288]